MNAHTRLADRLWLAALARTEDGSDLTDIVEDVATCSVPWRASFARSLGQPPPSAETWALVAARLRLRLSLWLTMRRTSPTLRERVEVVSSVH
jgi:hypothetical protein